MDFQYLIDLILNIFENTIFGRSFYKTNCKKKTENKPEICYSKFFEQIERDFSNW